MNKSLILFIMTLILGTVACKQNNTKEISPEPVPESGVAIVDTSTVLKTTYSFTIDGIITNYLILKNALTKDDTKAAASAADNIIKEIPSHETVNLDSEQMKSYMDIIEDLKENSEHIGANAGKIEHQREHFDILSKDVRDLITAYGTKIKLYEDFCPMYNNKKGAIWISETKEIKNPYYGSKMLSCGKMKKEL